MGLIRVQNVTKQLGGRVVLDDVTVELNTGEIVGLVGANGAGKTTLFKLIGGDFEPDFGTITRSKGLEVGYLPQEPVINLDRTLHDEAGAAFSELLALEHKLHALSDQMASRHDSPDLADLMTLYDRVNAQFTTAGGYTFEQRMNEVLGGLGFTTRDYALPMSALSGGQKCRAALAKLLVTQRQFLLLDEPTNHLDIDAVRWLEKFLASHHGGAVIISHDRYLLDRVADRIIEVERGRLRSYAGNYTAYVQTKRTLELTQERQYEKDQEYIAKERDFIARFLAGQRSQEAKGRRTRLERRIAAGEFVMERPIARRRIKIEFAEGGPEGRAVLDARGLCKRFDEKVLFENLSLQIQGGQRLGITGPNGTGKSMLLKSLLGRVTPDAGQVEIDRKVSIGFYAQEAAALDPSRTVLEEIRAARPALSEEAARSLLGGFLFSGDDVFKTLGQLSGGEQSRVRLICLILASPNMLVLDEPTNHLDIPSREALEEALADFPGTILVVSHDRYFLDRIVGKLLVMRGGRHGLYGGNYSFYIEQAEREAAAAQQGREDAPREKKADPVARPKRKAKPTGPYARLSLEQIEAVVVDLEQKIADITNRFADPAVCRDAAAVVRLQEEFDSLKRQHAEAETAWHSRAETDSG